jgi:hypothetical protein
MRTAARSSAWGRTTPAALEFGYLMPVEDRGTEAGFVAEIALSRVDGKPARSA